jgi:putative flippase GtrA
MSWALTRLSTNRPDVLGNIWRGHQKLRFLVVGAWNTAFAYAALIALYAVLHRYIHYLIISTLAHACAVTNAFVCQRMLVFHSNTRWLTAFLRFNAVQFLVLVWSLVGLAVMVELLRFQPFLGQLIVMTISVIVSYALSRYYAFKS